MAVASCAIIGGMVGSFDAAGRSLTGDGRSLATRPDREERRKQFFKKKLPIPGATDDAEAGHAVSSQ